MDPQTLTALYQTHHHAVFRRCRQIVRCEATAQELTQDVFLRLLEGRDEQAEDSGSAAYLYRAATNLSLNRLRDIRRRGSAWQQSLLEHWRLTPANALPDAQVEQRMLVDALLAETDPQNATIALSHYVDGLSQGEIAQLVGLSRVSVNQRLAKFRERAFKTMRTRRLTWSSAAGAVAGALACCLLALMQWPPEADLRPKGADVFTLYARRGEDIAPLGDTCRPGDQIRARYTSDRPYMLVFEVDGGERVQLLYPRGGDSSAAIGDAPQFTPGSWVLDAQPGDERFVAVFSWTPLDAHAVANSLANGNAPTEKGIQVVTRTCRKVTAP